MKISIGSLIIETNTSKMYQTVEQAGKLEVGKHYLVTCAIDFIAKEKKEHVIPVLNHPHNDKENGQRYIHYHTDYRFVKIEKHPYSDTPNAEITWQNVISINKHTDHYFALWHRVPASRIISIVNILLPCIRTHQIEVTPATLITKSKLKHDCIYKGKCPHRGYDLSREPVIDGKITCPLHGLQFNAETGKFWTLEDV